MLKVRLTISNSEHSKICGNCYWFSSWQALVDKERTFAMRENPFRQQDNTEIILQFKLISIGSINVTYPHKKTNNFLFIPFQVVVNFLVYLKNSRLMRHASHGNKCPLATRKRVLTGYNQTNRATQQRKKR